MLARYFSNAVSNRYLLPALAPATNDAVSLEFRVRSYLAANCAQCHQPGGTGLGLWDARIATPLSQAGIVGGALNNDGGDPENRVVAPGSPGHSVMLARISTREAGRMPPLDSTVRDPAAMDLLGAWITNDLARYQPYADWQTARFGSTNAPDAAPDADPDADGANNLLEYLTGTDPMTYGDAWKIDPWRNGESVEISFPQVANRGFQVEWAPDLNSPASWRPLDVPGNRPFYSATNFTATLTDVLTNAPLRFYRVRVFEP